jgi:hypothetical protein
VLERVPEDKLDWQAHPKSHTIGWNANHLAEILILVIGARGDPPSRFGVRVLVMDLPLLASNVALGIAFPRRGHRLLGALFLAKPLLMLLALVPSSHFLIQRCLPALAVGVSVGADARHRPTRWGAIRAPATARGEPPAAKQKSFPI